MRGARRERMHPGALFPDPHRFRPELGEGVEAIHDAVVEKAVAEALDLDPLQLLDLTIELIALVERRLRVRSDEVKIEGDLQLPDLVLDLAEFFLERHRRCPSSAEAGHPQYRVAGRRFQKTEL